MLKGWTLARYLGLQFFLWFLLFLFGLSAIIYFFEVAELLRRAANLEEATLGVILRMGLYKLPDTIDKILPFVVLFSSMFVFWKLTRNQELIVVRAAGISAWQFLAPALFVTLAFGCINVTLINPLGASMISRYQTMEAKYFRHGPSLELTGAGLWMRQNEEKRRYLIHTDQVSLDPLTLKPVIIFIYDDKDNYLGRLDGRSAVLDENTWVISSAWFNMNDEPAVYEEIYTLETSLTLDKIQDSMAPPNTISLWQLPHFIEVLRSIGLPPTRHELKLQTLLSQPLLLCSMVLFAAAFSLRLNRQGGILNAMMAGMLVGSAVFSFNNIISAFGTNHTLPVILAAWSVPIMALVAGQTTLLYLEDG